MFGKLKVVEVNSRAAVDAALASNTADSIVVHGNADLLRYAEWKAVDDPSVTVRTDNETAITTVVSGPSVAVEPAANDPVVPGERPQSGVPAPSSPIAAGAVSLKSHRDRVVLIAMAGGALTVIFVGTLLFLHSAPQVRQKEVEASRPEVTGQSLLSIRPATPEATPQAPSVNEIIQSLGPKEGQAARGIRPKPGGFAAFNGPSAQGMQHSTTESSVTPDAGNLGLSTSSNVPALAWAAVALAAIAALYLIARQAIAGGQNVEISWKVTSKVEGKVIISRIQARKRREPRAA